MCCSSSTRIVHSTCIDARRPQVDIHCGAAVDAEWNGHDAKGFNCGGWARHPRMCVGSLVDVGVYAIALITALLGPVVHVSSTSPHHDRIEQQRGSALKSSNQEEIGSAEALDDAARPATQQLPPPAARRDQEALIDVCSVSMLLQSGLVVHLSTSFSLPGTGASARALSIVGEAGTLTLADFWHFDTELTFEPVGAGGFKRILHPYRPPFERREDTHPHVTDWARGLRLMASGVARQSANDGAGRQGERVFTGDHAAHVVDVLAACQARGARCGVHAGAIASTFRPLPLLDAHVVPRRRCAWLGGKGKGRGGVPECSRIILGTMPFGDKGMTRAAAMNILDAAWALGINGFDLAHAYGKGGSVETCVGEWLEARAIMRSSVVLVGKACHPYLGQQRVSYACLRSDLADSLARLRTEYLDLLLLHRDDPAVSPHDIVRWMQELVDEGLVRAWGTSNWSTERRRRLRDAAHQLGNTPPVADSPQRSLARPAIPVWPDTTCVDASALLDYADASHAGGVGGTVVLGWAPLANGFLAGRWGPTDVERGLSTAYGEGRMIQAYVTEANLARRQRAEDLARTLHISPVAVAIAYALSPLAGRDPFVVVGTQQLAHLHQLVRGVDVRLTPAHLRFLEDGV